MVRGVEVDRSPTMPAWIFHGGSTITITSSLNSDVVGVKDYDQANSRYEPFVFTVVLTDDNSCNASNGVQESRTDFNIYL